jgi:hypothetical protein
VGIGLDLDKDRTVAQPITDNQWQDSDYFAEHTISLKQGEQQTFQIRARTMSQYCEFALELAVLDGSTQITQVIDNSGKPFRVTSIVFSEDPKSLYSRYQAAYVPEFEHTTGGGNFVQANLSNGNAPVPRQCGTLTTKIGTAAQVSVLDGSVTCAEALHLVNRYYHDPGIVAEGSDAYAQIDGWTCRSTSGTESEATGYYGSCTGSTGAISIDRP